MWDKKMNTREQSNQQSYGFPTSRLSYITYYNLTIITNFMVLKPSNFMVLKSSNFIVLKPLQHTTIILRTRILPVSIVPQYRLTSNRCESHARRKAYHYSTLLLANINLAK